MNNNENKVSMSELTVTEEVEMNLDPNTVKESMVNESDDINDSGMETTDVYKRQVLYLTT